MAEDAASVPSSDEGEANPAEKVPDAAALADAVDNLGKMTEKLAEQMKHLEKKHRAQQKEKDDS
jgi:cation transport regulator ChaC